MTFLSSTAGASRAAQASLLNSCPLAMPRLPEKAARAGDVLVVWKFDRLGRSLPHLIETVTDLNARRIGLRSLTENIATTTPGGRLIFHVFGALAAFERDLVKERTMAGLLAAARGRQAGRRPVVTPGKLERARALLAQGLNVREAATRLKIGKTALYDALANAKSP
jgi:DNA invertase Pin-like site-specific DNA recombinase